jgi:Ras-related protein Rab-3C
LVGNKCDLKDMRVVDYEKGVKLANSYELQFFETSAKDNINIKEVFISIAKDLVAAKVTF